MPWWSEARRAALGLLALTLLGCALRPSQAPERPLPPEFEDAGTPGPSSGGLPWRSYFSDPRLVALIDEGLQNNLDIAIAVQRIEQTRRGVTEATGLMLPRVDAVVGAGVRRYGLYTMDGAGNASTDITAGRPVPANLGDFYLGVQASWEIDAWGKVRNLKKAAESTVLASVEELHVVQTMLVADIAITWFELQALDHTRDVIERSIASQERALEIVQVQFAAGQVSQLAVQQFEARLVDTRALLVELVQEAKELEIALNVLLGRFPEPIERSGPLSFEPLPEVALGLPSELLLLRPDVRQAEFQVEATKFGLKAARAEFFPRINLSAALGLQAFNPAYLFRLPESLAYSVVGGMVAPLINRKAIRAQFEWADAAQLEAVYNYQAVVLSAFADASTSLVRLASTDEIVLLKREQKAAVEQAVTTAELLYRAGKASYLEVLLAQQATLDADLDLIDAWRKQRLASVLVYKSLGGGWQ
jgi:NodT family efflux transporter outer membrane factor (OMF) lipoprotein